MKSAMGRMFMRTAMNQGVESDCGRAVICTPFCCSFVTSIGSLGA